MPNCEILHRKTIWITSTHRTACERVGGHRYGFQYWAALIKGYTAVLVVVNHYSKYAHFGPLPTSHTTFHMAELFCSMVICLHGLPRFIISDQDPLFTSKFWKKVFELMGTKLCMSSAYHPQTDGQTEVLNRCLEQYLRAFVVDKPSS